MIPTPRHSFAFSSLSRFSHAGPALQSVPLLNGLEPTFLTELSQCVTCVHQISIRRWDLTTRAEPAAAARPAGSVSSSPPRVRRAHILLPDEAVFQEGDVSREMCARARANLRSTCCPFVCADRGPLAPCGGGRIPPEPAAFSLTLRALLCTRLLRPMQVFHRPWVRKIQTAQMGLSCLRLHCRAAAEGRP